MRMSIRMEELPNENEMRFAFRKIILRSEAARVLFEMEICRLWFPRKFGGAVPAAIMRGRRGTSPRSGLGLHRHMNDAAPGVCALRVSYE